MKKKIILALVGIALLAAGYGYYLYNKKVPTLESETADFTLTADELYNAFDNDEQEALTKYENKIIDVTGLVTDLVVKNGQTNIVLHAENAMAGGINCSFKTELEDVKENEILTVRGRCQGILLDVILNNCNLTNQ